MGACRPNVDVSALGVLVTQPLDGLFDIDGGLPFSQEHLAGVTFDADIEALAAHRAKLDAHQPLDDQGRLLAAFLAFFPGHWIRFEPHVGASGRAVRPALSSTVRMAPRYRPAGPAPQPR